MIKLMIAGDLAILNRTKTLVEKGNYESLFHDIRLIAKKYDYNIVNLESPIVEGKAERIIKEGRHHCCNKNVVNLLRYGHFNCVTLANNHFRDYGDNGVNDTLRILNNQGIDHVGGGANIEESSHTLYKKINNETVAIINCTEHEFSIASKSFGGANPLNVIHQYNAIQKAREKADYVLVIIHGGVESFKLPTKRMQETYRFFIEVGADAVVNHHQHCYSGYEVFMGKPIFYGLGNLCFDYPQYRNSDWNKGFLLGLTLDIKGIEYDIIPYNQSDENPAVKILDDEHKKQFYCEIEKINGIIADEENLIEEQTKFVKQFEVLYSLLLTPYSSRWTKSLYCRGILPSISSKRKYLSLLNRMECESHRDNFIIFLKKQLGI